MRVSTSTITNTVNGSMNNSYETYLDIIKKISSNKNFTKISENVPDATKVLKLNDQLAQMKEYQDNIQAATNEMNLAYDTLGAVTDELNEINSLIIQASNASTTEEAGKAIATEIDERVATIMDKMNTKYLDNFIFSGTYIEQQPYTKDVDGNIIYQGSSEEAGDRKLTIAKDNTFTYNFTGEEIFGKQQNGDDFFSQMKELTETLNTSPLDYDKIREKIGIVQESTKNIIQAQGNVSAKVTKLASTKEINDDIIVKLTGDKATLEEVDITKAATDLANAKTAMQASYTIGTTILNSVSLLDYLR